MIIESLMNLLSWLLNLLLTSIDIPDLPNSVATVIAQGVQYMGMGLGIFAAFTHYQFIMALLAITIIIDAAMLVYKFVVWLIRKIPMAGME